MLSVTTKSGIYNGYKVIGTQTLGLRGLVLWLKFNEGSGTIAYDSSFYNNHGTITGAVWTNGKFGKALSFDGVDDYVRVSNSQSLANVGKVTATLWVKLNNLNDQFFYTHKDANNGHEIVIYQGKIGFPILLGGTWYEGTYVPVTDYLEPNKWYFLAGTYDGETVKFYINGEFISQDTSPSGDLSTINRDLCIGQNDFINTLVVNGTIDEVRIYNRALSENEIKMLYFNRIGAVPSKTI